MRQPVKQIAYKYCVNFAKNWISVPNIVHQLTLSLRCKYCKTHSCSIFPDAINSIYALRRLAAIERLQANDVSLLWRHSSWVRGRSNVLIGHFWRFWGNLNPKMLSAIVWTPKRHFLTSQRVFWDISREIPCTGCFSRRVREKKILVLYFTICPDVPLRPIGTNFGLLVRLVDVINCAKFYRIRSRGFDSVRVEVWPSPLDCDVAVNTGGRPSTCDAIKWVAL